MVANRDDQRHRTVNVLDAEAGVNITKGPPVIAHLWTMAPLSTSLARPPPIPCPKVEEALHQAGETTTRLSLPV